MWELLWFLGIGLAAGWIAGQFTRGRGFGLAGNLAVGVVGSILGGVVFSLLGVETATIVGSLGAATAGAVGLVYLLPYLQRLRQRRRRARH